MGTDTATAGGPEAEPDRPLRVWVDLDNTPHPVFFRPIIRTLAARGHAVAITARASGRTVELARLFGLDPAVLGGWRGRSLPAKASATLWRAARLAGFAVGRSFDLAVSHGSRPLVLAAQALRIPAVTLYDYEGVSTGLIHRFSDRILVPRAVVPALRARGEGERVVGYDGVKEELYLSDYRPASGVRERQGVPRDAVVALVRPEADHAHYRPSRPLPLAEAVLDRLASVLGVHVWLLPRTAQQAARWRGLLDGRGLSWSLPDAVDGRDLVWSADLVVSGGGTMSREAAVLGVPAYTIFQGRPGAVDAQLEREGRLVPIRAPADAERIRVERRPEVTPPAERVENNLLRFVVDQITSVAQPHPIAAERAADP